MSRVRVLVRVVGGVNRDEMSRSGLVNLG